MTNLWRSIRYFRARAVCKTVGHTRRKLEVIDKASARQLDYLGHPVLMVERRHFECRRCHRKVGAPNDV